MQQWKQQQRQRLLTERANISKKERAQFQTSVLSSLKLYLDKLSPSTLALYWPIKGELDCLCLAPALIEGGWKLVIPVMDTKSKHLNFASWSPEMEMEMGDWNIPVPKVCDWLQPDIFLIPLVGFDKQNFRLGYGGGYYDRTLAEVNKSVTTVGIGFDMGRFESIHPHQYDIPMDIILTESGLQSCTD
jgi:5-formyltetrahydrofolate cyclo-ligase